MQRNYQGRMLQLPKKMQINIDKILFVAVFIFSLVSFILLVFRGVG